MIKIITITFYALELLSNEQKILSEKEILLSYLKNIYQHYILLMTIE